MKRAGRARLALSLCVAAPLFACGCGGGSDKGGHEQPAQKRRGGDVLVFAASPASSGAITSALVTKTVAVMRARASAAGGHDVGVVQAGARIRVTVPAGQEAKAVEATIGTPGRLVFYDWEANVVGSDGRTAPTDQNVTGGQTAGQPGAGTSQAQYTTLEHASKLPPRAGPTTPATARWYGIDEQARSVLCGPQNTRAATRDACQNADKHPSSYLEVPEGYIVVQAVSDATDPEAVAAARDSYFILRDRPALRGMDIKNPEQSTDQPTATPNVTFDFTSAGRRKWQTVTRVIARRGKEQMLPGASSLSVANHFAIVLDNKLVSVPYIDPQRNPDGIGGSDGSEISGGFSVASARALAAVLRTGELPLSLELVDRRSVSASGG
jgi:SecD/SecF fusion protein